MKNNTLKMKWWAIRRSLRNLYSHVTGRLIEYSVPNIPQVAEIWRKNGALIGKNVHINPTCYLDIGFASLLEIKDNAVIAMGTVFILHDSSVTNMVGGLLKIGRILVEEGAYLGASVVVLPGVVIGRGAIVGAGSLVCSDIPAGSVAIGRPAQPVCTVQELIVRYSERANVASDMVTYLPFPSPKEMAEMSPEDLKSWSILSAQRATEWLRAVKEKSKEKS